jgi:hypothetical protein
VKMHTLLDLRGSIPAGVTVHRSPGRYSAPSLLNSLLPHSVKRKVLFGLHPGRRETAGFPARLTAVYRSCGLRLSHRNVAEFLQQGEAMVSGAPDGRRLPR